jgi:hypothetical protein
MKRSGRKKPGRRKKARTVLFRRNEGGGSKIRKVFFVLGLEVEPAPPKALGTSAGRRASLLEKTWPKKTWPKKAVFAL